jgi:hypothetical protein
MKTLILFLAVVVITIVIGAIGFIFLKFETFPAIILTVVVLSSICLVILFFAGIRQEKTTLENPLEISTSDAGKMFRVLEIRENCLGLKLWGLTDYGQYEDMDSFLTYYQIGNIPKELQNCGQIFKVESTNKGLVYERVAFYGNKNRPKFEIFDLAK